MHRILLVMFSLITVHHMSGQLVQSSFDLASRQFKNTLVNIQSYHNSYDNLLQEVLVRRLDKQFEEKKIRKELTITDCAALIEQLRMVPIGSQLPFNRFGIRKFLEDAEIQGNTSASVLLGHWWYQEARHTNNNGFYQKAWDYFSKTNDPAARWQCVAMILQGHVDSKTVQSAFTIIKRLDTICKDQKAAFQDFVSHLDEETKNRLRQLSKQSSEHAGYIEYMLGLIDDYEKDYHQAYTYFMRAERSAIDLAEDPMIHYKKAHALFKYKQPVTLETAQEIIACLIESYNKLKIPLSDARDTYIATKINIIVKLLYNQIGKMALQEKNEAFYQLLYLMQQFPNTQHVATELLSTIRKDIIANYNKQPMYIRSRIRTLLESVVQQADTSVGFLLGHCYYQEAQYNNDFYKDAWHWYLESEDPTAAWQRVMMLLQGQGVAASGPQAITLLQQLGFSAQGRAAFKDFVAHLDSASRDRLKKLSEKADKHAGYVRYLLALVCYEEDNYQQAYDYFVSAIHATPELAQDPVMQCQRSLAFIKSKKKMTLTYAQEAVTCLSDCYRVLKQSSKDYCNVQRMIGGVVRLLYEKICDQIIENGSVEIVYPFVQVMMQDSTLRGAAAELVLTTEKKLLETSDYDRMKLFKKSLLFAYLEQVALEDNDPSICACLALLYAQRGKEGLVSNGANSAKEQALLLSDGPGYRKDLDRSFFYADRVLASQDTAAHNAQVLQDVCANNADLLAQDCYKKNEHAQKIIYLDKAIAYGHCAARLDKALSLLHMSNMKNEDSSSKEYRDKIKENIREAISLLEDYIKWAGDDADFTAWYRLATLYRDGYAISTSNEEYELIPCNRLKSYECFKKLNEMFAAQIHEKEDENTLSYKVIYADVLVSLGDLYEGGIKNKKSGTVLARDAAKALEYYTRGIDLCQLGYYERGCLHYKNHMYEKAYCDFSQQCLQNDEKKEKQALWHLGLMTFRGLGCEQNNDKAFVYFTHADKRATTKAALKEFYQLADDNTCKELEHYIVELMKSPNENAQCIHRCYIVGRLLCERETASIEERKKGVALLIRAADYNHLKAQSFLIFNKLVNQGLLTYEFYMHYLGLILEKDINQAACENMQETGMLVQQGVLSQLRDMSKAGFIMAQCYIVSYYARHQAYEQIDIFLRTLYQDDISPKWIYGQSVIPVLIKWKIFPYIKDKADQYNEQNNDLLYRNAALLLGTAQIAYGCGDQCSDKQKMLKVGLGYIKRVYDIYNVHNHDGKIASGIKRLLACGYLCLGNQCETDKHIGVAVEYWLEAGGLGNIEAILKYSRFCLKTANPEQKTIGVLRKGLEAIALQAPSDVDQAEANFLIGWTYINDAAHVKTHKGKEIYRKLAKEYLNKAVEKKHGDAHILLTECDELISRGYKVNTIMPNHEHSQPPAYDQQMFVEVVQQVSELNQFAYINQLLITHENAHLLLESTTDNFYLDPQYCAAANAMGAGHHAESIALLALESQSSFYACVSLCTIYLMHADKIPFIDRTTADEQAMKYMHNAFDLGAVNDKGLFKGPHVLSSVLQWLYKLRMRSQAGDIQATTMLHRVENMLKNKGVNMEKLMNLYDQTIKIVYGLPSRNTTPSSSTSTSTTSKDC